LNESSNISLTENLAYQSNHDLIVPPGFKPLLNTSPQDSQCTDEGIDRDAGSVSVFESAHSDYEYESVYLECREDLTIINEQNSISNNNNSNIECRNQPYRPRPYWNSNNIKYQSNYNRDQLNDKPRLKKPINLNKPPLPAEKKKNSMFRKFESSHFHMFSSFLVPCKYAAGGNCK